MIPYLTKQVFPFLHSINCRVSCCSLADKRKLMVNLSLPLAQATMEGRGEREVDGELKS